MDGENEDAWRRRDNAAPCEPAAPQQGKPLSDYDPPAYTNIGFMSEQPPPYSLTAPKNQASSSSSSPPPPPPPPFYPATAVAGGPAFVDYRGFVAYPPGPYSPPPPPPPGVDARYPVLQRRPYPVLTQVQTVVDLGAQVQVPPKDYLLESILVTLFCCLCTGLCAIITSSETRNAFHRGDLVAAQESSRRTRKLVIFSLAFGLCFSVCWLAYIIVQLYM